MKQIQQTALADWEAFVDIGAEIVSGPIKCFDMFELGSPVLRGRVDGIEADAERCAYHVSRLQ